MASAALADTNNSDQRDPERELRALIRVIERDAAEAEREGRFSAADHLAHRASALRWCVPVTAAMPTNMNHNEIEITGFAKSGGPLSKRITLAPTIRFIGAP